MNNKPSLPPEAGVADPALRPAFTASLYARGLVDRAMVDFILPWRRSWNAEGEAFLWLWRHHRHGQHLKIRVHAEASETPALRASLEAAAADFLDRIASEPTPAAGKEPQMPPLDADEDEGEPPQDRSFRWTRFILQRPIVGPPPLVDDPAYVAAFHRCLGAANDWILHRLDAGGWSGAPRAGMLLTLIAGALDRLHGEDSRRLDFLRFYRNGLLRGPLKRLSASQAQADAWVLKLDQGASKLGVAELGVAELGPDPAAQLAEPWAGSAGENGPAEAWRDALDALIRSLRSKAEETALSLDPFAASPLDPAVGKVLLAAANALGFGMVDQATLVHRMLRELSPDHAAQGIPLDAPAH